MRAKRTIRIFKEKEQTCYIKPQNIKRSKQNSFSHFFIFSVGSGSVSGLIHRKPRFLVGWVRGRAARAKKKGCSSLSFCNIPFLILVESLVFVFAGRFGLLAALNAWALIVLFLSQVREDAGFSAIAFKSF